MSDIINKQSNRYKKLITAINENDLMNITIDQLSKRALSLREKIQLFIENSSSKKFNQQDEFIIEAFCLVKASVYKVLNLTAYDEQLWAALALNDNGLVEMATGEGKTIAGVFSAYLNCLDYGPVHVYTFNDYLAKRDATMMYDVYELLGVTVSYLYPGQDKESRKKAYAADVLYTTVKECGFDYLREFLVEKKEDLLLPDFNYCIVDEADSILIDEARIPLVIASKIEKVHDLDLFLISEIVRKLKINIDYEIDEYGSNIFLTESGIENVENLLEIENLYDENNMEIIVAVNNALFAKELVKKDVDYIIVKDKIELVDEFTGRVAKKRHWPHGLHEAIEAKERINLSNRGQIINQITISNFMKKYSRMAGMTGTAQTSAQEFLNTYDLYVHVIPTHHPMIRVDYPISIFTDKKTKRKYVIDEVIKAHQKSRPVLIGTESVDESEKLSIELQRKGIDCQVLNAKNDEMEANLIADAGKSGKVTVSTNMAGRGTDIKLGGADSLDHENVVSCGGLLVIGTNLHESRRVDNQLRGRSGRQGDPGESKFLVSLEDTLFVKYNFKDLISPKYYNNSLSSQITDKKVLKEATRLQRIVEGTNHDIRDSLSKYTVMLQDQSDYIKQLRLDILESNQEESFKFEELFPDTYNSLSNQYGKLFVNSQEKLLLLRIINNAWIDYLDNMAYIKDSIHILKMSGMDPLYEYNKILFESFIELKENIKAQILHHLENIEFTENGIDFSNIGLINPESTWTYIVSNTSDQLNLFPFLESLTKIAKKKWL